MSFRVFQPFTPFQEVVIEMPEAGIPGVGGEQILGVGGEQILGVEEPEE
jgi:hypothetical protein